MVQYPESDEKRSDSSIKKKKRKKSFFFRKVFFFFFLPVWMWIIEFRPAVALALQRVRRDRAQEGG